MNRSLSFLLSNLSFFDKYDNDSYREELLLEFLVTINLKQMENQLLTSISIVELEERFETSVLSLDMERCNDNRADVHVRAL